MPNNRREPAPAPFRPPILSMAFAACWVFGGLWVQSNPVFGRVISQVGTYSAWAMAIGQVIKALDDQGKNRSYKKRKAKFDKAAKKLAPGGLATVKDTERAGLHAEAGLYLGTIKSGRNKTQTLRFNGEGGGLIISPPGGGKSLMFTQTLLTDPGTYLVHDPTLEIFACTEKQRRRMGSTPLIITPFAQEASKLLGRPVKDAGLNSLASIDFEADPGTVWNKLKERIALVLPDRVKTDSHSRYFETDARNLLLFVSGDELNKGRELTWPSIRQRVLAGPADLQESFIEALDSEGFAGELSLLANKLNGILAGASPQFTGGYGSACQAVELMDSSVADHLTGPGFDPLRLTSGSSVTLYVAFPGNKILTHQKMNAAIWMYLFQQVMEHPGHTVTALLDEAYEIGDCDFIRTMNLARKKNLRIFTAWQDLHGQAQERFGPEGLRQITSAAELLWVTNLRGFETCELLSKMSGSKAVESGNLNDRHDNEAQSPDQTFGRAHQVVPNLRPEEFQQLPSEEAIVMCGNMPPARVNKSPYFLNPELAALAGSNPYRGK